MSDIKMNLTVILPGSVMVSKEESLENSSLLKEEKVSVWNEVTKRFENIKLKTRASKPATQNLNVTNEAYSYMVGEQKPIGYPGSPSAWRRLKSKERLVWHLQNIAEELGGELMSYHIFND